MDDKTASKELMTAAAELVEAKRMYDDVLISAEEMAPYCGDCAAKIRSGSMKLTRAEFRKAVARMDKKAGWTEEGKRDLWSGLFGDVQAKMVTCQEKLTGIDENPAVFCQELADRMEPGWRG